MAVKAPAESEVIASVKKPLPLSKERLKKVFENTRDLSRLCNSLDIPRDKRTVSDAVEYYYQSTDPMKGRRMVFWLDVVGDTALADSVMDCAEPPPDPSFIPHHLSPVFQASTGDFSIVPYARVELFREKFSVHDVPAEVAKYCALYYYDPSWKMISRHLYRAGETVAAQLAKPHIHTVTDPSLTPGNILQATHHIPLWESGDSYLCLDMPQSQHQEIASKFDGEQAKLELFKAWLAGHPFPTWEAVRNLLRWLEGRGRGRAGAAEEVEETYLKMTPEKAQQILEASLKEGSLPLGYLKAIAVGVARSGKTLSKKHIFKIECDPNCSVSTGVCEAPLFAFRSVSWQLFSARFKDAFDLLTYDDINELLARMVRSGLLQGRVAEIAEDILKAFSKPGSSSSDGVAESGVPTPSGDSAASKAVVSAVCARAEAMAKAKREGRRLQKEEDLFKLQVILFLDSGGQPQFHELLPALSHNVGLVLIFIKLNECLDAPCKNTLTDKEGKWLEERCPSLLTNEQLLVQFVHTMMCKPLSHSSEGVHTMYMVIGTHRDLMHTCEETLAQKNERLARLLLPALEEQLIMNGKSIIFAVNAKNPNEIDEKCYDLIREKVSDLSVALHVTTPMCFLAFLNDMNKYGEQHKKRVVSMEECRAIAGRLKMERQVLEAALVRFNQMSMFMYMPSVLPGVVFIDPQMPLDSVNRIVQHSYRVGEGLIPGLTPAESQLWKEGVVTSEMLKGTEFSSCFVRDLFEADAALKLYQSLYIVAPLNESEFIMPATLQTVSLQDMKQYLPAPSEHVAPLLLHFHKSCIANGVFCSTHTCLRSKYGWKTYYVLKKGVKVPACLFRNAVKLQHPREPIKIMFTHAQKHFEVHVTAPQPHLTRVCPEIRDMLLDAVDSAATAFRYKNSRASVAFQCPCSPDEVHTATPNEARSHLQCTLTDNISEDPLTQDQRVWLGPNTVASRSGPTTSSTPPTTSTSSTPPTISSSSTPATTSSSPTPPTISSSSILPSTSSSPTPPTTSFSSTTFYSPPPTTTTITTSPPATTRITSPPTTETITSSPPTTETITSSPPIAATITSSPPTAATITSSPPTTICSSTTKPSRMAERPSLPELLNFRTITGETVNIIDQVGTHYDNLGVILLNDSDESIVDAIVHDRRETAKITKEILKRWIRGMGKQPVTWKTLTDTLQTIRLSELASPIVMALTTPPQ